MMPSRRNAAIRRRPAGLGLPLAVLLAGAAVSGLLYTAMRDAEERAIQAKFGAIAEDRFHAIEREIEAGVQALRSVGAFYAASRDVERKEFRAFVTPLLDQLQQVHAFDWVPRVSAADRHAFEAAARADGLPAFRLTELTASGAVADASPREAHFPLYYAEPQSKLAGALGFDLASDPAWARALRDGCDRAQMIAAEPITPIADADERSCIVIALPIFRGQTPPETVEERTAHLAGFARATLPAGALVENALARLTPQWVDIYVRDMTEVGKPTELYAFASRLRSDRRIGPLETRHLEETHTRTSTIKVANRQWKLVCVAAPQFASENESWHPMAALVGGGLLSVLAAGYARTLATRHVTITRLVSQRTEELARANQERERFFMLSLDLLCTADTKGHFTRLNPAWEKTLGFTVDELLATPYIEFVHPDDREATLAEAGKVACGLDVVSFENRYRCKDGSYRWLLWSATTAPDRQTHYASARDVTERKEVEKALLEAKRLAEDASRAKSNFLATMSHELRTPLNGVIGMTELLLGTQLDGQQRRYAWLAKSSGEALLALISDVLDFSKIEADRLELERIDFNLQYAVENVVGILASRAHQKGLEVACRVHPSLPQTVRGDPGRFQQILMNLLSNAIKFTEKGEVVVRATMENETSTQVTVRVTVTDTGIGIPADRAPAIFKSFSQADTSTTRKYGGTGLGLAIAKRLLELMQGSIGVESSVGAGSTFWFTAMFEKAASSAAHGESIPYDLRSVRILIVDDNATNREILSEQLGSAGMQPESVSDAPAALAALRCAANAGDPFGMVLTDLRMPEMDGYELAKAVKSDPLIQSAVLLLLSSQDEAIELEALHRLGFSGFLMKPIRESQLVGAIAEAMACGAAVPIGARGRTSEGAQLSPRSRFAGARILVAEDHEISQEVALTMLAQAGFVCEAVADGKQAVEAALSGSFHLVLMDCQMPEMDGFEATRAIRKTETTRVLSASGQARIPIVAATANAIQGDRERCVAAGMDDYVSKPLVACQLLHVVEAQLAKHGPTLLPRDEVATPTPRSQPFNRDALSKRWGSNEKLIERLTAKFQARSAIEIAQLEQAIGAADAESIARFAHGLKGAAAYVEAQTVRDLAARIEVLARRRELAEIPAVFAELRDELCRCAVPQRPKPRVGVEATET